MSRNLFSVTRAIFLMVWGVAFLIGLLHAPVLADPPVIDVWYGLDQSFGFIGNPQKWVNILGNVTDPDGIQSLVYSLNGEPDSTLSLGPDDRRLADPGDFNIDLDIDTLNDGANTVIITATDMLNNISQETVILAYAAGNVWPLPYTIDWETVTDIQDAAQPVDGKWEIENGAVRTTQIDYDRVLAVGDMSWRNYEITVPMTVNDLEPVGPLSGCCPGVGMITRWKGHTDDPVAGWQPKSGWKPSGGDAWYIFGLDVLRLSGSNLSYTMNLGQTYMWKLRVETPFPQQGGFYSLKVWPQGQPEPTEWVMTRQRPASDEPNGSLIFVAHHTDITIGDVLIEPIYSTTVSDDFNSCALNTSLWTIEDPLNDGSIMVNGTQVLLSVPEGEEHNVWGTTPSNFVNNTLRIMQPTNNTDFEVEAKYESGVDQSFQQQGILIQQDGNDLIRIELTYSGGLTSVFVAWFDDGIATLLPTVSVAPAATEPHYLRVKRVGDEFTVWHSLDGSSWSATHVNFSFDLVVSSVGVFAGNSENGGESPAHTAVVDYFFNNASPIDPEDGDSFLPPEIVPIDDQIAVEGVLETVTVIATDPNDDPILLASSNLPSFVSFADNGDGTGALTLDPQVGDAGIYPGVVITATDPCGLADADTFTITVETVSSALDDLNSGIRSDLVRSWPNPFNPQTNITFELRRSGRVRLEVYDLLGRRIVVLLDESRPAGIGSVVWDGRDQQGSSVASAVYVVRLETADGVKTQKLMLAR